MTNFIVLAHQLVFRPKIKMEVKVKFEFIFVLVRHQLRLGLIKLG